MKNLTQHCSVLKIGIAIAISYLVLMVNAHAASLEIHPNVLSALGKRPSFTDKMIVIDDVGKGSVDYEFMVSQTQITVQDWVDFLNVVDRSNPNSSFASQYRSDWSHWRAYEHSGGRWRVKSNFNNGSVTLSASNAANLPVDGLSLNQVARYMNWLATGSVSSGAFSFSGSSGNSSITGFNANFPGARLPLAADLEKAMYWHKSAGRFRSYPTGSDSAPPAANVNTSTGTHPNNKALFGAWSGGSNAISAQVGQERLSPWGLHDVAGNRHETTLNTSNYASTVVKGASAFHPIQCSMRGYSGGGCENSRGSNEHLASVGYRVWAGVPKRSGKIAIKKVVSGGSDATRQFSFNLDCDGTLYDKSGILLKHNETFTSVSIPQNTKCTVTETPPSGAPSGYTYGAPQYSMAQPVTIGDNTTQTVTVTNPLQPSTPPPVIGGSCPAGTVPSPVNLVINGGFTTSPSSTDINKHAGKNNTTPGYFYSAANFYSQVQYRGYNTYPTDFPASGGDDGAINKFSIISGIFDGHSRQLPFPGDPVNNVPAIDTWFYSNGNGLGTGDLSGPPSAEYLLWEQTVNNLVIGKTYSFSAYINNILEYDGKDDPIVRLRIEGTQGRPNGTVVFGPYTLTEAETYNSKPLNGWKRIEYTFQATKAQMRFKVTSAAPGFWGDDFGLTAVGVNECVTPGASLTISKTVTGDKPLGFVSPDYNLNLTCSNATYNRTVKLKDGEKKVITDIPSGVTCSLTETLPVPPVGYAYAAPIISPASVTLSNSNPSAISVTNTLSWKTGSLRVTKQVTDKPAGFTSPDYAIVVDCSDNSFDQTVLLKDGASKLIGSIPENTTCTVSEPTLPTAPTDHTYVTPVITPAGAVSILANQTVDVTVTNKLEQLCIVQEDNILNGSTPAYGVDNASLLANNEYVYMPLIKRSDTPLWSGNLKKFARKDGRVVDKNGKEVTNAFGEMNDEVQDFWSTTKDGKDITKGGAANKLPLPDARKLYTDKNNRTLIELKAPGVTPAMMEAQGAPERNQWLDFIRGKKADGSPRYHMGDMLTGKPELVSYDATTTLVFMATNEGYLHAIDAATGVEKWAFMPNALLKNVKTFYENALPDTHVAGIDGALNLWRFQYDSNNDGKIDVSDAFKTYLYFGLRSGGAAYYMLDVSNTSKPELVWHINDKTSGFSELGEAWSKPALAKMRVPKPKPENVTHDSELVDVLVFGGGYGMSKGRNVYIADAKTGDLLWSLRDISGASDGLTPASALVHSIPGDIRVLDMDRNGALDRLYFADTGGTVWRVDMDVDLHDLKPTSADTFYDYSKARLSKFAELGGTSSVKRQFFFEPDVALMEHQGKTLLFLSIGSGNRALALDTSVQDRFYVMVDRAPYNHKPDSSVFPIKEDSKLANIDNASSLGTGLLGNAALNGWYYALPNSGEKVLASSNTVLNKVVFSTFTPGSVTVGDSCENRQAKARAYVVDLFTGAAVADLDRKGGKERALVAAKNELLDGAQLVFHKPSNAEAKDCTDKTDCTQQFVEVRVGRMSRPLIDSNNSLVAGVVDGKDMDLGKILPRAFWRDAQ
ncbi:DUF5979 domain-containing protein [Candidatus Thiothrix anitrata]|uniref:SUMF1/EgtB/PvdO family nonheme iron enzyme n=1 Tax=Candidatus Thiothrix anitrata TaxID=2823902 RepID=A0ABX7X3H0_9GAMM|nr:DUF5979 domain-containing protein [Candidatus Thiothrix anitrata]QTR49333.1 SUMF1/EgtB/PvdO family nonheme iron enzyme [Candidatus Thiothrix anitrata]